MDALLDEKKDLLCRAIAEKRLVQFKYSGRSRIVEPFCFGKSAAETFVLRGFQIRGADKTKPLCWRLYELSEISQLNITQHNFNGKRSDYDRRDPSVTQIICSIS
jgi:hypothetical protein